MIVLTRPKPRLRNRREKTHKPPRMTFWEREDSWLVCVICLVFKVLCSMFNVKKQVIGNGRQNISDFGLRPALPALARGTKLRAWTVNPLQN